MRLRWFHWIPLVALLFSSCATTGSHQQGAQPVDPRDHPLGTGSVEFVGIGESVLQDIRVIPEEGTVLYVPQAGVRIENVDGFWWKGNRLWFKIPDHCHTTITMGANGQLESEPACSEFGTRIQILRGGVAEPAWQIDSGSTGHGTDYPF